MKKPIIVYLSYGGFGIDPILRFIKQYNLFESGTEHELQICLKNHKQSNINFVKENVNVECDFIIDDFQNNDYDIEVILELQKISK